MRNAWLLLCFTALYPLRLQAQNPPLSEEEAMKAEMALIDGQKYLMIENYARALEMFEKAAHINPYSGTLYYKMAYIHFTNESLEEALLNINQAMKLDADNKYFALLAADIHMARSDLPAAEKIYKKLSREGSDGEVYSKLATLYLLQGKDDEALETLTRMQAELGTNVALVEKKQQILLRQGRVDEVLDEWRNLVRNYPTEPAYANRFLELLLDFDKLQEADSLIALSDPSGVQKQDYLMSLALEQLENGAVDKALETATPALLSPRVPFQKKGWFLQQLPNNITSNWPEETGNVLEAVADLHRNTFSAQALIGDLYVQMTRPDQALVYYKRAQRLDGGQYAVWENILQIQLITHRYDSLVKWGERALEYYPNQSSIYYFLGSGYLGLRKTGRAESLLQLGKRYQTDAEKLALFDAQLGWLAFLEGDRESAETLFQSAAGQPTARELALDRWSQALIVSNTDLRKAKKLVEELLTLSPRRPDYLGKKGRIAYLEGAWPEARELYEQALSLGGESGTILEQYGDVLFRLGEEALALEYWKKAQDLPGASIRIKDKIADKSL